MKDDGKTRRQLISELVELRQRIAESEKAEIERRRTEESLRIRDSAMVSSINALASADLEGSLTYVNPAFLKLWGYDDEQEVLGRPTVEFWQMEEKALNVIEVLRDGGSWLGELVAKRKDGSLFDVQVSASMVTDEAGESIRMMASFVDITERKRVEETLRESESRLSSILSSMVDLVFVFDNEGRFIFYHCPSLDLLHMPPEKFMGKKHSEVMPLYVDKAFAKAFNKNKKGEVGDYEYLFEVGGETSWYSVKLSPMLLDDEFAGSVAVIRDITERKRAEESLKSAALETLGALSRLVEANDPYTSGHSATVTEVAIRIAQEMGLEDGQIDSLRIAGPLHDVGKVGIPSSVLNKPSVLTQAEWVMIQAHPQVSANVAQQVTAFAMAVPVIRHHHERWDGTGYPDALKGDGIPLPARILAVADGFQAMTSERPYRRARTEEEALTELEVGAGTQWDPEVVKLFLKLRKPPFKRKSRRKRRK